MEVEKCLSPKALLRAVKVLVHGRLAALPGCGNGPRQISVVGVRVGEVAFIRRCGGTGCLGWSRPLHYNYPPQRSNTGRPVTEIGLCPWWW